MVATPTQAPLGWKATCTTFKVGKDHTLELQLQCLIETVYNNYKVWRRWSSTATYPPGCRSPWVLGRCGCRCQRRRPRLSQFCHRWTRLWGNTASLQFSVLQAMQCYSMLEKLCNAKQSIVFFFSKTWRRLWGGRLETTWRTSPSLCALSLRRWTSFSPRPIPIAWNMSRSPGHKRRWKSKLSDNQIQIPWPPYHLRLWATSGCQDWTGHFAPPPDLLRLSTPENLWMIITRNLLWWGSDAKRLFSTCESPLRSGTQSLTVESLAEEAIRLPVRENCTSKIGPVWPVYLLWFIRWWGIEGGFGICFGLMIGHL